MWKWRFKSDLSALGQILVFTRLEADFTRGLESGSRGLDQGLKRLWGFEG